MQVVLNRHKMCRHFHWQAWVGSINIYIKEVLFCSESEFLRLYYIAMLVHFLPIDSRNRLACDILVLLQHIPSSFVTPSLQTDVHKTATLVSSLPNFQTDFNKQHLKLSENCCVSVCYSTPANWACSTSLHFPFKARSFGLNRGDL